MVGRYVTTRLGRSALLRGSTRSLRKIEWDHKMGTMNCVIRCIMRWDDMRYKMRWCKLSTPGAPTYILPVSPSITGSPLSPYTCRHPVHFNHPGNSAHPPSLNPLRSWLAVVVRNGFSNYRSYQVTELCIDGFVEREQSYRGLSFHPTGFRLWRFGSQSSSSEMTVTEM